jgi:hypothetical protein
MIACFCRYGVSHVSYEVRTYATYIGETRQQRKRQDDRLGQEHAEWAHPCDHDLTEVEALLKSAQLIGAPELIGLPFFSPSARRFLAMRSMRTVVRVSGTKMACAICTAPPKMSWIQMFQRQARNCSTKPPTMGPSTEPPTEEKTMKACICQYTSRRGWYGDVIPQRIAACRPPTCPLPWRG